MDSETAGYAAYEHLRPPGRDPVQLREQTRAQWHRRQGGAEDVLPRMVG